ncbi:MAG: HAD family hydrolase, partial [Syntrophobacteraceae bacterium]|nr:HAD family hydrolase [Syntrophobacteraceae bacterium]
QRRVKAAVITRNCEEAVRLVFPDVDRYCGGLLARDHVPKVKPDPDHLLRALEVLACGVEGVVMVGDHPLDVETGKRAECSRPGFPAGGFLSRSSLVPVPIGWPRTVGISWSSSGLATSDDGCSLRVNHFVPWERLAAAIFLPSCPLLPHIGSVWLRVRPANGRVSGLTGPCVHRPVSGHRQEEGNRSKP